MKLGTSLFYFNHSHLQQMTLIKEIDLWIAIPISILKIHMTVNRLVKALATKGLKNTFNDF